MVVRKVEDIINGLKKWRKNGRSIDIEKDKKYLVTGGSGFVGTKDDTSQLPLQKGEHKETEITGGSLQERINELREEEKDQDYYNAMKNMYKNTQERIRQAKKEKSGKSN